MQLGFIPGVGEFLDDLKPERADQPFCVSMGGNPGAPPGAPRETIAHPRLAARDKIRLGLDGGVVAGAEGEAKTGQFRCIRRRGGANFDFRSVHDALSTAPTKIVQLR